MSPNLSGRLCLGFLDIEGDRVPCCAGNKCGQFLGGDEKGFRLRISRNQKEEEGPPRVELRVRTKSCMPLRANRFDNFPELFLENGK